ncbi:MAG TPA: hypothetical protein VFL91_22135 [Thermomicrobiales bacterium]|nr:hypothetical protein [Thermomicrobiales bacterium]
MRDKIARGQLRAAKDGRAWVVILPPLTSANGGSDAVVRGSAAVVDAADELARVERAVVATATRYMGDLRVMLGELREVYEGRIRAAD